MHDAEQVSLPEGQSFQQPGPSTNASAKRPIGPAAARDAKYNAFISYSRAVDGRLAPALQTALYRFAKPWYRVRAMHVFRDDASLSANPGLWSSIEEALASAEFLLLLASPEAAHSSWVDREVSYWCQHKPPGRLLIALTDGDIAWDTAAGDFDWRRTTALPPSLQNAFVEEPRYIDLRWAHTADHLSMSHPAFRDCVADLAAPLHGRPKDELVGEDVRQHRRTVRLIRSAVALLAAFAVFAAGSAVVAFKQRDTARSQTRLALSRQLATDATATFDERLDLGLLLSVEALRVKNTVEARKALLAGLERNPHVVSYLWHQSANLADVDVSPDGRTLAVSDRNGVALWDLRTNRRLGDPLAPAASTERYSIAFSPNGKTLALGTSRTVTLWDIGTHRRLGDIMSYDRPRDQGRALGQRVTFSPDGRTLVTTGMGGAMWWDVGTNQHRSDLVLHQTPGPGGSSFVWGAIFSPDGRTLVTFGNGVDLWDARSHRRLDEQLADPNRAAGAEDAAFSPDGRILATADNFGATLWDFQHRRPIGATLWGPLSGGYVVAFSPDGSMLAMGEEDGTLLWDVRTHRQLGDPLTTHPNGDRLDGIIAVSFSTDGRYLTTVGHDGVVLWDLWRTQRLVDTLAGTGGAVWSVALSPDGRTLASTGSTGVLLRDSASGRPLGKAMASALIPASNSAFSPDGRMLATGGDDGVSLWDVRTRQRIGAPLSGVLRGVYSVAFSPDGKLLAAGERNGTTLWDLSARRRLATLAGSSGDPGPSVRSVAFSPDGTVLAVADYSQVTLWDVRGKRRLGEPLVGQRGAVDVAFSPDGRMLLAGNDDEITLWDVRSHRRLGEPLTGQQGIDSVAVSPDGSTIASASIDRIALWDTATHRRLGDLVTNPSGATTGYARAADVTFSPDGKTVLFAGSSDSISIGNVDVASWGHQACRLANRELSQAEWDQFIGSVRRYEHVCQ